MGFAHGRPERDWGPWRGVRGSQGRDSKGGMGRLSVLTMGVFCVSVTKRDGVGTELTLTTWKNAWEE